MTEHEKLVERVAKAIYASEGNCYTDDARMFQPFPWEELDDDDYQCVREGYRAKARAAIAECYRTLMEPSDEVVMSACSSGLCECETPCFSMKAAVVRAISASPLNANTENKP